MGILLTGGQAKGERCACHRGCLQIVREIKGDRHLLPEMATTCPAKHYLYDANLALQRTRISNAEVKSKEKLRDVA